MTISAFFFKKRECYLLPVVSLIKYREKPDIFFLYCHIDKKLKKFFVKKQKSKKKFVAFMHAWLIDYRQNIKIWKTLK